MLLSEASLRRCLSSKDLKELDTEKTCMRRVPGSRKSTSKGAEAGANLVNSKPSWIVISYLLGGKSYVLLIPVWP